MANQKNLSIKRFGARYGRNVKHRFAAVEAQHKKSYSCPYCHAQRAKRVAVGIWQCTKCDSKFTGRAYTLPKKKAAEVIMPTSAKPIEVQSEEPILSQGEEEDVVISKQPDIVGVVDENRPKPVEEQPLDVPMDMEER